MRGAPSAATGRRLARVAAPAKVNLFLRVLDRRPDGFHDLETLFQAVSLADRVSVEVEPGDPGVRLELDGPDLGPVEDNLAVRAARAFLDAAELALAVRIELRKEIPAGAGLGGGSSDAAAVLRALGAVTGGPLSRAALMELGAGLGSDVPFFLGDSPLAAGTGRGERLEGLEPLPPTSLVLVLPPTHVATGEAYRALAAFRGAPQKAEGRADPVGARGHVPTGRGPPRLPPPPSSWAEVAAGAWNDFQQVVAGRVPEVRRALDALTAAGGQGVLLSGSGAACLAFFPDRQGEARRAAKGLSDALGWPVRVVRTLDRLPLVETAGSTGG